MSQGFREVVWARDICLRIICMERLLADIPLGLPSCLGCVFMTVPVASYAYVFKLICHSNLKAIT